MSNEQLLKWLERCLAAVMKYIDHYEGNGELTGKAYHTGQKDLLLLIIQELRKADRHNAK